MFELQSGCWEIQEYMLHGQTRKVTKEFHKQEQRRGGTDSKRWFLHVRRISHLSSFIYSPEFKETHTFHTHPPRELFLLYRIES